MNRRLLFGSLVHRINVRTYPPIAIALTLGSLIAMSPLSSSAINPPAQQAATDRVLQVIQHIASNLRTSMYRHDTRIDERSGRYEFDCSAMAAFVLARSAPRALATVGGSRPLAIDFFHAIIRAPIDRPRAGWRHIARIEDARPGDVLAWQRPPWFRSNNTGHVAFVVGVPQAFSGGYLVRIADASSYNHQDDTRAGSTGFGIGTILITIDPTSGAGTGYSWAGRDSLEWIIPTPVAIGRPVR